MSEDFKNGFLKTLWILKEYLPVIIIGGGWAPLIYYHYLIKDKSKEPIRTRDIDLFVKINLPVLGNRTVDQLLVESGLQTKFKDHDNPPVIHYEGDIEGDDVEIEFLTDKRGAKEDNVIVVQKGLHATALRFVSIILENSIEVNIDDFSVEDKSQSLKIRVPSPPAYIFHKGLIFNRRKEKAKGAKDLYYIFDILANCNELEEKIFDGLKRFEKDYSKWFSRFLHNMENSFSDLNAEGVTMVSSQRPANAFPELKDAQLKQYIFGKFQRLLGLKKNNIK
jgi:predicted nucleotidyltransferase